ncbi:HAMP domain-containing histidine kinase [Dyella sp. M7H15-1]|uniref:sensor histidine kinase n=1 Tax=Dyella sp. M7H15-1 TaxID=2501295 RepID=UPI001004EBEB|nr:HAMP domain-containing sensor histidine kinase [Dyella sp. M7H15-1]QAU25115.1 HAMP domain-containing histidine kinase [Dyella sp. M7H15-1]
MTQKGAPTQRVASARGGLHRRLLLIFGLQLVAIVLACLMGYYNVAPVGAVLALIVIVSALAWLAAQRAWRSVSVLAQLVGNWQEGQGGLETLPPDHLLHRVDADVAMLARSFHHFANRIAGYNERERNFTRDASHELRSPLTVIKMSIDMLEDEAGLSDFGKRSVERIRRATREMEALVEAMLILAREADNGQSEQDFVVNDVLRGELADAREMLHGHPIELQFEESAKFALHGSPRVFAVLCWQLIRHASQYTGQGTVLVTVLPGVVSVCATAGADLDPRLPGQQGFEYAIARRISERFAWPLDLHVQGGNSYVAEIRFPQTLPV